MAEFHFVEDYEKYVARLIREYPIDEAMAHAVGGHYEHFGKVESGMLRALGLRDGMRLVDLGCGSGRLATALHASMKISYLGTDIVQALLDYAKGKAPTYEFRCHRELSIPAPDASADMISAFSLFTHLLQAETYLYLEEGVRVLKPGGCVVFSFLEFTEPTHWDTFVHTREATRQRNAEHLNMFIERPAIEAWAGRLGLRVERYVDATESLSDGHWLGQSVVVLRKPAGEPAVGPRAAGRGARPERSPLRRLASAVMRALRPRPPTRDRARTSEFHFVEDYERLVARLVKEYPIDEAMAMAVGGSYESVGKVEAQMLRGLGLEDGMHVVDLGCGSGRLASALHASMKITYVGTDIVQQLLDYAQGRAPTYEFRRHRELSVPQLDARADFVTAFSLFTHLLQAETYLYLEDAVRVLKPGGRIVFSFLEFAEPAHWPTFSETCDFVKVREAPHLNIFIERPSIEAWAGRLGVAVERYVGATEPLGSEHPLGQSVAVLRKPG